MGTQEDRLAGYMEGLLARHPVLRACREDMEKAYGLMEVCYGADGKMLIAGNGGSASDAEHIVGELMKGFTKPRRLGEAERQRLAVTDSELGPVLAEGLQGALPAIALEGHPALSTAWMNDCSPELGFAQQVNGYGRPGDVLLGISTSGNSRNILYAAVAAKAKGMKVIGLTGRQGGKLAGMADVAVCVPGDETYLVQEFHLPIYHCWCLMLEERFFA